MVKTSTESDVDVGELEQLLNEFPQWKREFPQIYKDVQPEIHHKNRKPGAQPTEQVIHKKRAATVPSSDYQATYGAIYKARPRSTKKPPPTPRDPCPPPMTLTTNQRSDFVPKDLSVRPQPVIKGDTYEHVTGPFDPQTVYHQTYKGNYILPKIKRIPHTNASELTKSGQFDSRTTNQEHYKKWVPQPSLTFGELPCFTASILYPKAERLPATTTHDTFKGVFAPRADLCRLAESYEKPEGSMDLDTVNRLTYHSYNSARPAEKVIHHADLKVEKRGKFQKVTQSKLDFPDYNRTGGQPRPPRPCTPPPATIDLKFDNEQNFVTEQRKQFPGVDAARHPPPKLVKKEDETQRPTGVKFEAVSNHMEDFPPIDVSQFYKPPIKGAAMDLQRSTVNLPKFTTTTSNKESFKKWQVEPRVRYGDLHEMQSYYEKPQGKFEAKTTTGETFLGTYAEIPALCKRPDEPVDTTGERNFDTVHRTAFAQPSLAKRMNKHQKKVLLRELRKRKYGEKALAFPDNKAMNAVGVH